MTTGVQATLSKLRLAFGQMEELGHALSEEQWKTPSPCPCWTVQDLFSHIVGTELMMMGEPAEQIDIGEPAHVHNDIARMNEVDVLSRKALKGSEVFAEYQSVINRRMKHLEAMSEDDFAADAWTPTGPGTYADFLAVRILDVGIHEQDARDALGLIGHQFGVVADHIIDRMGSGMGFVVGKLASAPDGSSVHFALSGGVRRDIYVQVDGRANIVAALEGEATATLTMNSSIFQRLAAGRIDPAPLLEEGIVELSGDEVLGHRILTNMGYMI